MNEPALTFNGSVPEDLLLRAIQWSGLPLNLYRCPVSDDWSILAAGKLTEEQINSFLRCVTEFRLRATLDSTTHGMRKQIIEEALIEVYSKR